MNKRKLIVAAVVLSALSLGVWSVVAHEGEHHSPGGNGQPGNAPLTAMAYTPCAGGMAGPFPCDRVDLAALLPTADIDSTSADGVIANDIWGWTDSLTDREYALLGLSNGVAFVDVTTPSAPVHLGNLPRHSFDSTWRSLKVYRDHLFVVSEAVDHGMQVFDLRQLRNVASPPQVFAATAHYNNFGRAHTIAVNEETGFAYAAGSRPGAGRVIGVDTCGLGLHVVDVRNPAAPAFAGCVDGDGYTHETQCVVYRGPDAQHRGREVCFSANEDTLTVTDVTNKAAPAQLSRTPYDGSNDGTFRNYAHQGWLTGDHARLLLNDEFDETHKGLNTRTFVWDVSDLDAPSVLNVYQHATTAIDHNLYVRGLHAFESNYRSGVRVLDVRNAATTGLSQVGFFDVYTADDKPLFNGTWSNYPFFASGTVIASGMEQGLFVLRPQIGMPVKIDYEPFFVRQHYRDFLGREPDEAGLAFWNHEIEQCMGDAQCREVKRINVSAAFFLSIEFQETGFLYFRAFVSTHGRWPTFDDFMAEARQIGQGVVVGRQGWEQQLEANKRAFLEEWMQRPVLVSEYPLGMPAADYVAKLFGRAGVLSPPDAEVQAAITGYGSGDAAGRGRALRVVVESQSVKAGLRNAAFVTMQYYGYLRRQSDGDGFSFWWSKLNDFNGDYIAAEMVKAFIQSAEYRARFGQ